MTRNYDVVVLGASGFTGQFVVEELRRATESKDIKLGISGRNEAKLKNVLKLAAENTGLSFDDIGIIITDVTNDESLLTMARQSRLVINCVGPYRHYGEKVVVACIESGTHHIDISGEPQYLESMQLKFNERAEEEAVYIIGACGFDSVPADMGSIYLQNNFPGDLNSIEVIVGLDESSVGSASINVTTLECAIDGYSHRNQLRAIRQQLFKEKLPRFLHKGEKRSTLWWSEEANRWCVPNMAADKSVVSRSQYFNYKLFNRRPIQCQVYFGMQSIWSAIGALFFGIIFGLMTSTSWTKKLFLRLPSFFSFGGFSAEGAKREDLKGMKFKVTFIGKGWSTKLESPDEQHQDPPNVTKVAKMIGPDPGYFSTAIIVIQSALTLLEEKDKLPKKGGIFTPGTAFLNTSLIERLQKKGILFEMTQ